MEILSLSPGFRFHPTDTELAMYYLKKKLLGKKIIVDAIAEVNIYDFSPWDLKDKSLLKSGDLEWYFFCPKGRKYTSGSRSNRSTEIGFWKATGKDKKITYKERTVATRKTLVFHLGHGGKGQRTDWVMHEYKMEDEQWPNAAKPQDAYVICKIFEKSGSGPKNGAQYGEPFDEEKWDADLITVAQTEAGSSSIVTYSAAENLNCNKLVGPATMNTTLSVTEPGCSVVTVSEKEEQGVDLPTNDDVIFMEDIASLLEGVEAEEKSVVADKYDGIYDNLVNFIDLEELNVGDLKNDGTEYTSDKIFAADDLDVDLTDFYVD